MSELQARLQAALGDAYRIYRQVIIKLLPPDLPLLVAAIRKNESRERG